MAMNRYDLTHYEIYVRTGAIPVGTNKKNFLNAFDHFPIEKTINTRKFIQKHTPNRLFLIGPLLWNAPRALAWSLLAGAWAAGPVDYFLYRNPESAIRTGLLTGGAAFFAQQAYIKSSVENAWKARTEEVVAAIDDAILRKFK